MNQEAKAQPDSGFIGPGLYRWWAGGVLAASVLVAIAAAILFARGNTVLAWAGPLAFGVVFLCMFDTRGVFRAGRMIAAIAAVVLVERLTLHVQLPNRLVLAGIIAVLLAIYSFGGGLAMAVGKHRRRGRSSP
jgi:hypothetical protein